MPDYNAIDYKVNNLYDNGVTDISIDADQISGDILEPESEEINHKIVFGKPNGIPEFTIQLKNDKFATKNIHKNELDPKLDNDPGKKTERYSKITKPNQK